MIINTFPMAKSGFSMISFCFFFAIKYKLNYFTIFHEYKARFFLLLCLLSFLYKLDFRNIRILLNRVLMFGLLVLCMILLLGFLYNLSCKLNPIEFYHRNIRFFLVYNRRFLYKRLCNKNRLFLVFLLRLVCL